MEQVYWISTPIEGEGPDTRNLVYRYGRFVYAGPVITEPILGLEYLPGVLQGIQAVQGQIPYVAEVQDLPPNSDTAKALAVLDRAMLIIHNELQRLEPKLTTLAGRKGNSWLEDENSSLYFEFEAQSSYSCYSSDCIFAKTFRGEVMLTIIWFGGTNSFYVTLSAAGEEEQALVDTLFPAIYGKRRGIQLISYDDDKDYPRLTYSPTTDLAWCTPGARRYAADLESKLPDTIGNVSSNILTNPTSIFNQVSVWESDGDVPDPDVIRARDEALLNDGEDDDDDEDEKLDEEEGHKTNEDEQNISAISQTEGGSTEGGGGPRIDVSGGNGYTQVYIVMQPNNDDTRHPLPGGNTLVSRSALFRFGNWIYAGKVEFPVETLRLGDVPYVLPALQKQQGRLGYVAEATNFPANHFLASTVNAFMAAVGILRHQMEDAQEELSALAEQSVNAWIDADWAASFFELSFVPSTVSGIPPSSSNGGKGTGLASAEVIASKIYMFEGSGIILHCVWFQSSIYCVLADSVEDLPLLDVAFPDVTARNRVVQVRSYEEKTARKLMDAFPGAPLPKALRVWEGRRKGIPGVGFGAMNVLASDKEGVADSIRQKARERAEAEQQQQQQQQQQVGGGTKPTMTMTKKDTTASDSKSGPESSSVGVGGKQGSLRTESKTNDTNSNNSNDIDLDADDDLYDMSGLKQSLTSGGGNTKSTVPKSSTTSSSSAGVNTMGKGVASSSSSSSSNTGGNSNSGGSSSSSISMPSQLFNSVARAPHHLAPLGQNGSSNSSGGNNNSNLRDDLQETYGNRLIMVGGGGTASISSSSTVQESKDAEAPWDSSGKPKNRK